MTGVSIVSITSCRTSKIIVRTAKMEAPTAPFKPTKAPVVVPVAEPVKTAPAIVYNYTPSTYENRADWYDEPCAKKEV